MHLLFSHSIVFNSLRPRDCNTPGFPGLHYVPEFAQTHVHWVNVAIELSHPLSPPSPLAQHHNLRPCVYYILNRTFVRFWKEAGFLTATHWEKSRVASSDWHIWFVWTHIHCISVTNEALCRSQRSIGNVVSALQELTVYKEMDQRRFCSKTTESAPGQELPEQTKIPNAGWVMQNGGCSEKKWTSFWSSEISQAQIRGQHSRQREWLAGRGRVKKIEYSFGGKKTCKHSSCSIIIYMGKESEKECIYVYV